MPHANESLVPTTGRRWVPWIGLALLLFTLGLALYLVVLAADPREVAMQLVREHKLAEAEPHLLKAYERNSNDLEVVTALSLAKLGSQEPANAEPYLTRWAELQPQEARAFQLRMDLRHRVARGRALHADRLREMELALADGQRVLEIDSRNDAVRREVVWLALQVGQYAVAESECKRGIVSSPRDGWLHFLHAKILHARGRRAEAEKILDPIVQTQPNFADAILLRAILFLEADEASRAVPLLRQALTLKETPRRECLYRLGLALSAMGQTEEAGRVLAEVNLLNLQGAVTNDHFPNNPAMRVQIAEAMLGMGRLNEAKTELEAVLAADANFAPAHRVMALYHERRGEPDRATEHRRRAGEGP